MIDNREGRRCSAFKANGEPCRAHVTGLADEDLCIQHLLHPVKYQEPRKPRKPAGFVPEQIPEMPDDDWEHKLRAWLAITVLLDPDEYVASLAALAEVIRCWRIDNRLIPAPAGWVFGNP